MWLLIHTGISKLHHFSKGASWCFVFWHHRQDITVMLSYLTHPLTLQWRHNEHDGVSNHQPHDCLLNRLFRRKLKKTPKLRVTGLCAWNSPVTGDFPAQMASNAENLMTSSWRSASCHDPKSVVTRGTVVCQVTPQIWYNDESRLSVVRHKDGDLYFRVWLVPKSIADPRKSQRIGYHNVFPALRKRGDAFQCHTYDSFDDLMANVNHTLRTKAKGRGQRRVRRWRCHIFPWLCVWDGCTTIFSHLLHTYLGNTGTLFQSLILSLLMFSLWYLQMIGYSMACRSCSFVADYTI